MTENLKIEVSMVDVEGGVVDTSLATKEELNEAVQSKADLIEGKIPVAQLPNFDQINGVSEAINGVETKLRNEVATALGNSNSSLESRIDTKLVLKADLVNGRVPASQSPAFKDVEGAKGALDGLKEALTTKYDQKVLELSEGKADLVDGKIPTSQLPIDGIVTPLDFQLKSQELDTKFSNLEDSVEAEKNAFITQAGNLIAGKANAIDVYNKATVDNKLDGKVDVVKYNEDMAKKADQVYVDAGLTAVTAGHKAYATLALAQAAQGTLLANTIVEVTNDPTTSNNGTYQWNGTTLTKSAYDPLTQAKADASNKANAAEANSKNYADSMAVKVEYLYTGNNLIGSKSKVLEGMIYGDGKFTNLHSGKSVIIPVKPGEIIYMHNSRQTMTSGSGFWYGFYANTPAVGDARIGDISSTLTDPTSGLSYIRAKVPATAKYLVLNTKFGANTATWNANYTGFINSFVEGTESVYKINGVDYLSEKEYLGVGKTTTLAGNIYDPTLIRTSSYIPIGSPSIGGGPASWTIAVMPAEAGRKYYAKIESTAYPFNIATYNGSATSLIAAPAGTALTKVTLKLVDEVNKIYEIVFDPTFTGGALAITTKVDSGGYNHNIENTLKVYADWLYSSEAKQIGYSQYDNQALIDLELRKKFGSVAGNNELLSKIGNIKKSIYCFGDSITQGTQGGYTKYLTSLLDATVSNYGSSGANTNRLYGIVLGKASRNGYDGTTVYPTKDYTLADIVTIMIGTNDFNYGDSYWDSIGSIPVGNVYEHIADNTTDAYFESFPANFAGNVGACIEYIRWKNPKCKIYLIAPPQRTGTPTMLSRVPYIKAIADYYAVTFINGTGENGLCAKDISVWSYDNLHLNTLGNEIFGKYLAKKIASS